MRFTAICIVLRTGASNLSIPFKIKTRCYCMLYSDWWQHAPRLLSISSDFLLLSLTIITRSVELLSGICRCTPAGRDRCYNTAMKSWLAKVDTISYIPTTATITQPHTKNVRHTFTLS